MQYDISREETFQFLMPHALEGTIIFNKPYGVVTRFTDRLHGGVTLSEFISLPGVYPVGRLDKDSEGLLLLTSRKRLVQPLLAPGSKPKTYLVCVEGEATDQHVQALEVGVSLPDGWSRFERVTRVEQPSWLWPRTPPIRYRKSIPVSWLEVVLKEGRNRQVRRTTAAVGLPTLRLIRTAFGPLHLGNLALGTWRPVDVTESQQLLLSEQGYRTERKLVTKSTRRRKR